MPAGRPTIKTPEVIDELLQWIESGKSLAAFCRIEENPARWTICRWLDEDETFSDRYARAHERQAELLLGGLNEVAENEAIEPNRAAQIIKARTIMAEKLAPKKYGPQQKLEHTGKDDGPVQVQITYADFDGNPSSSA